MKKQKETGLLIQVHNLMPFCVGVLQLTTQSVWKIPASIRQLNMSRFQLFC